MKIKTLVVMSAILLASVHSSIAALVNFIITGEITGTGTIWDGSSLTGTVTYDDSKVGSMPTVLQPPDASLTIQALGQTFTQDDDNDSLVFGFLTVVPSAFITSGQDELALTFIVSEFGGTHQVAMAAPETNKLEINLAPTPVGQSSYEVTVDTNVSKVAVVNLSMSEDGDDTRLDWSITDGRTSVSTADIEVHRAAIGAFDWQKIADVPAGTTTYTDSTAGDGSFVYRLKTVSH